MKMPLLRRLAALAASALIATSGAVAAATPAHASGPVVGGIACHSSVTHGWRCGTITHVNLTIWYPSGPVHGVFRYTACGGPRDAGIPVYSNNFEVIGHVLSASGSEPFCYTYAK